MYNRDYFAEAKSLSLVAFLESFSGEIRARKQGASISLAFCPSCGPDSQGEGNKLSIKADEVWHCFKCNKGGSIIDAGIHLWGLSTDGAGALESSKRILGDSSGQVVIPKTMPVIDDAQEREIIAAKQKAIAAIFKASRTSFDRHVHAYLTLQRSIPRAVLLDAGKRGLVGSLPSNFDHASEWLRSNVGEQLLRESTLWKPGAQRPWIVYRPLVFFFPGHRCAEFRLIRETRDEDEKKSVAVAPITNPYFWRSKDPKVKTCAIVEGMIDLMSAVALGYSGHLIAIPGISNWKPEWGKSVATALGIEMFDISLDNDLDSSKNWGKLAVERIGRALQEDGIAWRDTSPKRGDLNDFWRARFKSQGIQNPPANVAV